MNLDAGTGACGTMRFPSLVPRITSLGTDARGERTPQALRQTDVTEPKGNNLVASGV
jgi:hypothetical protein